MVVKLVEIYEERGVGQRAYKLREVFINPDYVVCLRDEPKFQALLKEGRLPEGIDSRQQFTRVQMNRGGQGGLDVVVVGPPQSIEEKIGKTRKKILKG